MNGFDRRVFLGWVIGAGVFTSGAAARGDQQAHMHPGMTMIPTDAPLTPDSRSGKDFVIVTTG